MMTIDLMWLVVCIHLAKLLIITAGNSGANKAANKGKIIIVKILVEIWGIIWATRR